MPNLSRRLTKASDESVRATQRIAAAEGRIVRSLIEFIETEEVTEERPMKNVTPKGSGKTEEHHHGRQH